MDIHLKTKQVQEQKKNIQLCENIMYKYNNYKKNDNIIIKARDITLVVAGVGVGDKSRHHRPVGRLKTCSICVHMYIYIYISP